MSSSYAAAPAETVVSGKKLQVLDGITEFFWASEPTHTRLTLVAAEIDGATSVEAWQGAVAAVQRRYPLLSACIRKIPGERPYLESLPDVPLALRVVPYRSEIRVDDLIAKELLHSFDRGDSLLGRVTLCHNSERTILLFVGHHSAFDGRTNTEIICDLIAAASGETLGGPLPLLPTVCELLELPQPEPYSELLPGPPATLRPSLNLGTPKVKSQRMGALDLNKLVERARSEKATLQGALVAAFLFTGRRLSPHWQTRPVVCLSPIDLRPLLSLQRSCGVITSAHFTTLTPSEIPAFWDFARAIQEAMRGSRSLDAARTGMLGLRKMLAREWDPYDLSTFDPAGQAHDLKISNYGDPKVRTDYSTLRLRALYPSHLSGQPGTQSVSAITIDGELCVCHAAREILPSLLEDSLALLREACTESLQTPVTNSERRLLFP
jgi:hypothetical protein